MAFFCDDKTVSVNKVLYIGLHGDVLLSSESDLTKQVP